MCAVYSVQRACISPPILIPLTYLRYSAENPENTLSVKRVLKIVGGTPSESDVQTHFFVHTFCRVNTSVCAGYFYATR